MEAEITITTTHDGAASHLNTLHSSSLTTFNRVFALIYTLAILALFYHHALTIFHSTTFPSFFISLSLLFSDVVLAFMWATTQSFRMNPVHREESMDVIETVLSNEDYDNFPPLDVFICTDDQYKEPPINVVNTALSIMAYDYPADKISVYVSDDGGSTMTLFAFMEAAEFATQWLPFCRENDVVDRNPDVFFACKPSLTPEVEKIKMAYENMKIKIKNVVEKGKVGEEYIKEERRRMAFNKWNVDKFAAQTHPTIIEVILEKGKHADITGHALPNLVYVSRQKSKNSPHHFKAGALNALLRVSAIMTNAPIILTQDRDMYSNDPQTLKRVLCYMTDPEIRNTNLGYIQFPQRFHAISKNDIYASEHKRLTMINSIGMDGLSGPNYSGTGCFFPRRVFFGSPLNLESPELPELGPNHIVQKPIQSSEVLEMAHLVAGCEYENGTKWGTKLGFRYGALVEDYYTGYLLRCEGWKPIFCNPDKAAFYGDTPISLFDTLSQIKRWSIGLDEVAFSEFSPVTFGIKRMGPLMGLSCAHYAFLSVWSIPVTVYSFLPQLALFIGVPTFPQVSDQWFFLYAFLFIGAYGQDLLDFIVFGGTFRRWWNDQRMWLIKGLSSYLFGSFEFLLNSLDISSTLGFNVTSKEVDDEQSERYEQEIFEFGVESPLFVPFTTAAVVSLAAFVSGLVQISRGDGEILEGLFGQMFVAGFGVINSWPVYEAMILRNDDGRMPFKITVVSLFLSWVLFSIAALPLWM